MLGCVALSGQNTLVPLKPGAIAPGWLAEARWAELQVLKRHTSD